MLLCLLRAMEMFVCYSCILHGYKLVTYGHMSIYQFIIKHYSNLGNHDSYPS